MKTRIGAKTYMYPMPVVLVGANVNGKPNYLTVAYCGIAQHVPPMVSVTMGKHHYTNAGIRENGTFSVNIPRAELVVQTDYCGLNSGSKVDKSKVFNVFYGDLKTAPMIRECPVNMECRLMQTLEFGNNELFIGEVVVSHVDAQCLSDGKCDVEKINPFLYEEGRAPPGYWRIGGRLATAFHIGTKYRPKAKRKR
jgi:flavin reductase (DIM6/NTAB) family NADH-FMN oxidoreductase RutF